jgi:hypothetical protein
MNIIRKKLRKKVQWLHIQNEIKTMGFEIKAAMIGKVSGVFIGTTIAIGSIYRLQLIWLTVLLTVTVLCVPYYCYHRLKNQYDHSKWKTRLDYMEQMLSSFKRHPKMLEALQDTYTIFIKGEIHTKRQMAIAIQKAIYIIQSGEVGSANSIYRNAVKEIETEFGCHRLTTMHDYMEKVEQRGGEYKQAADILLSEHALWKTNMEKLKKDQATKRVGIYIITSVCVGVCALPAFLDSLTEGFTKNILYQICSMIFLIIVWLLFVIAENKLNSWWNFDCAITDEQRVLKNYQLYQGFDLKKSKKTYFIIALGCYLIAAVGLLTRTYWLAVAGIFYGVYISHYPVGRYRRLYKSVRRALEFQYPQWMMELTLLLQTENVYVSLQDSVKSAPLILRKEINRLTARLENEPDSVEPYNDFFADLNMDNISTSMRNLYSIDSLGIQEESTLLHLIEHNNELLNKAEQIKGQERINVWTVYMYLPLLSSGVKIIMDTLLLCAAIISSALKAV